MKTIGIDISKSTFDVFSEESVAHHKITVSPIGNTPVELFVISTLESLSVAVASPI